MYELELTITQEHINSSSHSYLHCPIARSLRQYFSINLFREYVSVQTEIVEVSRKQGQWIHFDLCDDARDLMETFDDDKEVSPCTVHLVMNMKEV